jgi:3-oxoacyl-[acyl-carrier protein] reductase
MNVKRRHALVTGGSGGIGLGIVGALLDSGVRVTFCGRDQNRGMAAETSLSRRAADAHFVRLDIESDAGPQELVDKALRHADIDILVNNVGNPSNPEAAMNGWLERGFSDWQNTFYKNVITGKRLCDLLAPRMRERQWGRIINISSSAAIQPGKEVPADYSAAKAALNSMSMTLARALAFTGVTVNTVTPGPILTDGQRGWIASIAASRQWLGTYEDWEQRFIKDEMRLIVNRLGSPKDIGRAVVFLASDDADFVTGSNLRVDGGQTLSAI